MIRSSRMKRELRERSPEQTLQWIKPLAKKIGISRIAEVTWLDSIGLHVYQAFRPYSKNLVVSQGKGLRPEEAEISAIMESMEFYHAEDIEVAVVDNVSHVQSQLSYEVDQLAKVSDISIPRDIPLRWTKAINVVSEKEELIPFDMISLNFEVCDRVYTSLFRSTSNGLASGNSREEAILHGLYEVIERDCLSHSVEVPILQQEVSLVLDLIELIQGSNLDIKITYLPNPLNLPCFKAYIKQENQSTVFFGSAAHCDKEIALSKAIIEAIQSRLTLITGTRDDILKESYTNKSSSNHKSKFTRNTREAAQFAHIPSISFESVSDEYVWLIRKIKNLTNSEPLTVDLTKADLGIPVFFSVIPNFSFKVRH